MLEGLAAAGVATVSSGDLAGAAGVNSAQLRRDLSCLGSYGTRGVGYDVAHLRAQIGRELGFTEGWPVVIVGLGNLGRALAGYAGFGSRGFRVVALVDADPALAGVRVGQVAVSPLHRLEQVTTDTGARIGVIATPAAAAQSICDRLVAAGVSSILSFAPSVLSAPAAVRVRKVDLGQELQILAYHEQRRRDPAPEAAVPGPIGVPPGRRAKAPAVDPTTAAAASRRRTGGPRWPSAAGER